MKTLVTVLLVLFALPVFADTPVASPSPSATPAKLSVEQMFNFEQVEQVANYLGAKAENPQTKILNCDMSAEKSTQILSSSVRSLLDTKRADEIKKFHENPKSYIAKVKGCWKRCTCNAYNMMLSDMTDDATSNDYKDLDAILTLETKKLTKEQSLSCAKSLTWYCKSKLRSYLIQ